MTQHIVRTTSLNAIADEIVRLNKRAAKIGVEPLILRLVSSEDRQVPNKDGVYEIVNYSTVELVGETPRLEGWTFVAALEHTEAGNIIRTVPGHEDDLPVEYREVGPDCDHCGLDRRRKDTFVVRHQDGHYAHVGRTCLKDFTGHANPLRLAAWFEAVQALVDDIEGDDFEGGGERRWSVLSLTVAAAAAIRVDGFTSRRKAKEEGGLATADTVGRILNGSLSRDIEKDYEFTAEDEAVAEGTIAWVEGLAGRNDYEHNLQVVFAQTSANARALGFIAAAVNGFRSQAEKNAREQATTPVPTGRQVVEGEVVKTDVKDNAYGVRYVFTVRATEGFLVWGTIPKAIQSQVEVGSKVRFTATLDRSDRDETFGFFSRPSKAEVVA